MKTRMRMLPILLLTAAFLAPPVASAKTFRRGTILDALLNTAGAEALVAAVQVVDEAGVTGVNLTDLLRNGQIDLVVFAPSNSAFETLLGLDAGSLSGLSVAEIKDVLPGLLPEGVGPAEVAAILAKHVAPVRRTSSYRNSVTALLREGSIEVADGSTFPIAVGPTGVAVNVETTIIRGDVRTRNGFIHFVDTVITDGLLSE